MVAVAFDWIVRMLSLAWLTGPIFDKEMRVSSRRRRNYVLRFFYIELFALLMTAVWVDRMPYHSSSAYQSSRMAQAGQAIVLFVLWFEFIAGQSMATIMLSTSISDEIYHRTLGVLMTTPISAFQIVIGKLLSKLLQLVLLLAISLPLLAIVRVFGGVPWSFLACGLCVTLTMSLFMGSLSLFFSIFTRRAYAVMIGTALTAGLLFWAIPLLVAFLAYYPVDPPSSFWHGLLYVNPYAVMTMATLSLYGVGPVSAGGWPIHCAVLLGVSGLFLLLAVVFVRKAALRQAMGQAGFGWGRTVRGSDRNLAEGHVRRVKGPPVLWKECRMPLLGRRKVRNLIVGAVVAGLIGLTYVLCYRDGALGEAGVHRMYILMFFAVGMLFTTVLPATCVASEKESQTWPLLLTTAISERDILLGKFAGVVRRCLPAWGLLFGHILLFAAAGIIHSIALLQLGIVVAWVVVFLSCTGLYCSVRFKHTTTAVIVNLGLAAAVWVIIPMMGGLLEESWSLDYNLLRQYVDANPFVQAVVIAEATTETGGVGLYQWVQDGMRSPAQATDWILCAALPYVLASLALVTWAAIRMRRSLL